MLLGTLLLLLSVSSADPVLPPTIEFAPPFDKTWDAPDTTPLISGFWEHNYGESFQVSVTCAEPDLCTTLDKPLIVKAGFLIKEGLMDGQIWECWQGVDSYGREVYFWIPKKEFRV